MTRIIIDAGHGGTARVGNSSAFGGRSAGGLLEKDVTLDIARAVVNRLGGTATLTRTSDANLSLGARTAAAGSSGADVFVSIHANSGPPDAVGPETWIHPEAGAGSRALASTIQASLQRLRGGYGGGGEPRPGAMAVLAPSGLGRRTAACLVEVDYLTHPDGARRLGDASQRAAYGAAIADAITQHLRRGHASALDASEFDDADQLGQDLVNARASDNRRVSTQADGLAVIAGLRSWTGTSPWSFLHRDTVADRLSQVINQPELVDQAGTPLCGPACFYSIWAKRDPRAFANHAATLFKTGAAPVGKYQVRPGSSLIGQDYGAASQRAAANGRRVPPEADWMLLSAMRNTEDDVFVWDGSQTGNTVSGITFPQEVVRWLDATGLYASITNGIGANLTALQSKGYNDAAALRPAAGVDIVCLISAAEYEYLGSDPPPRVGGRRLGSVFPDHYVILTGSVHQNIVRPPPEGSPMPIHYTTELPPYGSIAFPCWSWGAYRLHCRVRDAATFASNYYGGIVATMRT